MKLHEAIEKLLKQKVGPMITKQIMQVFFSIGFLSATVFLCSCNKTPDLTKDEVYKIMNEIIADDSLGLYVICSTPIGIGLSDEFGFSAEDKKFIERQNEIFKGFKYEPNKLKYYSWRIKAFDFIEIDTTCNAGIINRLSFPLISADRQRVVFENTEDCHCMLGGQGGQYLYIKKNGHWKFEKSFGFWVSEQITPKKISPQLVLRTTKK